MIKFSSIKVAKAEGLKIPSALCSTLSLISKNEKKQSKYKNVKTIRSGIKFDSAKEAKRYHELQLLERTGKIRDIELQPEFILQDNYKHAGKTIRAIIYRADFRYFDVEKNMQVIEDVKGLRTEVYKIKKKLLLYRYPNINFIET